MRAYLMCILSCLTLVAACGDDDGNKLDAGHDATDLATPRTFDAGIELPDLERFVDVTLDATDTVSVDAGVIDVAADGLLHDADAADTPADTSTDMAPDICIPDCTGKECGGDGCGNQCGQCADNSVCQEDGQCACLPLCEGKACGDDGCNGTCGDCQDGETCTTDGVCCAPNCAGLECGSDGCGEFCGQCTVGGLCIDGLCCYPDCEGMICGDDGCGGSCGQCSPTEVCDAGHCLADPLFVGCSDGSREGFLNMGVYPLIAACGGAWDVPGIHNDVPACNREAGNSGLNAEGIGCNVTDLCAEQWHVCLGRDDVDYRSPLGCVEIMDGALSPAFFLVRTSSTGAMNCAPDTIGEPTSINDLFGCGDLGCPANEASCEPLQVASHDLCKSIKNKPTSNCACYFPGELDPSDPKYKAGDFENVFCQPSSGGCGWCKPLDYYNKMYDMSHPDAWNCGTNTTQEAIHVVKSFPEQQGGVLCCQDQCETAAECDEGMICIMSTCQLP